MIFVLRCLNDASLRYGSIIPNGSGDLHPSSTFPRSPSVHRHHPIATGAWSVYSTVRYFIAFTRFTSHERHIINLVLGSVSALCTLLVLISFLLSAFVACLGWKHANILDYDTLYNMFQSLLGCSASFLLLGPPIVNLIFVILWKSSSPEQTDRISGRCSWDIDALWSGRSIPCNPTKVTPWGFWLVGAVARLFLTTVVAVSLTLTYNNLNFILT